MEGTQEKAMDGGFDRWPVRFTINAHTPEQIVASIRGAGRYEGAKDVAEWIRKNGFSTPGCSLGIFCQKRDSNGLCLSDAHGFVRGDVESKEPLGFECEACGFTRTIPAKLKLNRRELKAAAKHKCKLRPTGEACGREAAVLA